MRKSQKIVIVGGASTYTPGIIGAIVSKLDKMPVNNITLQDIDEENLKLMGKYIKILFRTRKIDIEVEWTTDLEKACENVDFVFAQIRPGSLEYRELDEKIPLKYGVVGQETCGPGGFAFAMRTIKPMIEISRTVKKVAPEAWIINYSNPLPIIAEGVLEAIPDTRTIWICDKPYGQGNVIANILNEKYQDLRFEYFGLNHFGWFTSIKNQNNEELLNKFVNIVTNDKSVIGDSVRKTRKIDEHNLSKLKAYEEIVNGIKLFPEFIPLTYMKYYYFSKEVADHQNANYTRANEVIDGRRKETHELIKRVVENNSVNENDLEIDLHGMFIVEQAVAISTNEKYYCTINVKNNGIFSNFPNDAVIETDGYIDAEGAHPSVKGKIIPEFYHTLMIQQNAYEKLTVKACLEGSKDAALKALSLNKCVPSFTIAKNILNDFEKANENYWPKLT